MLHQLESSESGSEGGLDGAEFRAPVGGGDSLLAYGCTRLGLESLIFFAAVPTRVLLVFSFLNAWVRGLRVGEGGVAARLVEESLRVVPQDTPGLLSVGCTPVPVWASRCVA